MLPRLRKIGLTLVLVLVVAGHIGLWLSDQPFEAKLRLTLLNAGVWAVILLPAVGVGLWLRAVERQNR